MSPAMSEHWFRLVCRPASGLHVFSSDGLADGTRDDPAIARYWEAAQQCFDTRFGWAASVPGIQALVGLEVSGCLQVEG